MSGLGFLDLVIGLVFIYFLLSLVVSALQEIRANIFRLRAKNLELWFKDTLDNEKLGETLLNHKLIAGLVKGGRKPSYIPNEHFVSALLDTINSSQNGNKPYDINSIRSAVENTNLLPDDLKRHILQSISEASGELKNLKDDLSQWFDSCMERVAGTYKNIQQKALLVISLIAVSFFNADSISLAKFLYENEDARVELATTASEVAMDSTLQSITKKYVQLDSLNKLGMEMDSTSINSLGSIQAGIDDLKLISGKLSDTKLPLGWSNNKESANTLHLDFLGWLMKVVGLLISGLAVSLGTPFWFDILNKLVNIRGAGSKPRLKQNV